MEDLEEGKEAPKTGAPRKPEKMEAEDSTVHLTLNPELLRKLTAAAKASGQSEADWIREAIAEAISRKSK